MQVVVVGLNHKTAPIGLLERVAVAEQALPKALHQLQTYEHVLEAALLSTCNRAEVYAVVSRFHGGVQDVRNFFSEFCHVAPEDLADNLYTYYDDSAVRHLLRVASGIDSLVVGESEILGQVRRAYQVALAEGSAQRLLGAAFRRALRTGKRARRETGIAKNPASVSSAAVELARRAMPGRSLAGRRVLVVGAGKMGRLAARALTRSGAGEVVVINRSPERARELAAELGVEPLPFGALEDALVSADILICSTTSPAAVVRRALVERALARRRAGGPLFIVDIAVPRDVDPEVASLPGVVLRDIEHLKGVVEASLGSRMSEVAAVERIVDEELGRFLEWQSASEIGPTIAEIVGRVESIRRAEFERLSGRLAALSDEQRAAVEQLTRRIAAKILHGPIDKARALASAKQGHLYLSALRELFELDERDGADDLPT